MKIPFFRISGIIVFVLSVISLILFKNLFIKFLATTVLLLSAYLAVYYLIILVYFKKKKLEFTSIEGKDLLPFKEARIEISGSNFPAFFPGIFFMIQYDIIENGEIYKKSSETISEIGSGKIVYYTVFDKHGKYSLENFRIVFCDIFGFSRYVVDCGFGHEITVLPIVGQRNQLVGILHLHDLLGKGEFRFLV